MSNIFQDMIATKAVVGKRAGVPCILNQGAAMQQCNSNISVHIIPIAPRISWDCVSQAFMVKLHSSYAQLSIFKEVFKSP